MDLPEKQGLYDPRNEHDSVRRRLRGRHQGPQVARHHPPGPAASWSISTTAAPSAPIRWWATAPGCMIQTPDALLRDWARKQAVDLPPPGHYAVAMCFLPQDEKARHVRRQAAGAFHQGRGPEAGRLARRADRHDGPRQGGDRDACR